MTDLRAWVQHKSTCPKAHTYRAVHIEHVEWHDDPDIPLAQCHSKMCQAWASGKDAKPDCTCGLDAALQAECRDKALREAKV